MTDIVLKQIRQTDLNVTVDHFGGNAVYTRNTHEGTPTPNFVEAVNGLNIGTLRYPAGQPDIVYAGGMVIEGKLPAHLLSFLDAAVANGHGVVIVTPTFGSYPGANELREFTELLMESYSDTVHAIEIGNEYWALQTETEYSAIATESIEVIDAVLQSTGHDIDIWVQMGSPEGKASEFNGIDMGWVDRNVHANQTIIDGLSDTAKEAIDGVVEHFYFRDKSQHISDFNDSTQFIGQDFDQWQDALGEHISLNITEWNIRTTNLFNLGTRAASTMQAQFQYIIELGADEAYVWPPQHNTSSDLGGGGEVFFDEATGVVVNSVGGAMFSLMALNLPGLEYVETEGDGITSAMMNFTYVSDDKIVCYIASRSNNTESISYSLGDTFGGAQLVSATVVGYDQNSSDGQHYDYTSRTWVASEYVMLDGSKYYLNEHDVRAQITVLDTEIPENSDFFDFSLQPYEVIQLVYEIKDNGQQLGTEAVDKLQGSEASELFYGLAGDDVIVASAGADTIFGGPGDDYLNSGADADLVYGGLGSDSIRGWGGSDTIYGDDGDDEIWGWYGRDLLVGGTGNDTLYGGDGSDQINGGDGTDLIFGGDSDNDGGDFIVAGAGSDTVDGGYGNDEIYGGDGADILSGGFGADTVIGQQGNDTLSGGAWSDLLFGGDGNDFINGGFGHDRLNGGEGADTFFHLGIQDHGADWIQDFSSMQGDVLFWGGATAVSSDFQVNFANTSSAGSSEIDEAFVIYRPTGQVVWALVDGGGLDTLTLVTGVDHFDLI